MAQPRVLLTNDDGIDAVGLHALHDGLGEVADVTVVAPTEDRSGAGRRKSHAVSAHEHERGTAIDGTPVDCVAIGRYQCQPDLVVAGCNPGPNIGAHKLSQSGTVSAAMEAAFLGIPGIAVSAYDPERGMLAEPTREDFAEAVRVTRFLVSRLHDADWLGPDWYFNVTVPTERSRGDELRLTRPARGFDRRVVEGEDDREFTFDNRFYDPVVPERDAPAPDPDTDLGACADHVTSVSPLHVGVETIEDDRLVEAFAGFGDDG
ncbi:5'/3'-nucleotidase SurE [Haloarchaeobius amylolyticus]|uniref:5'/3'-nucleotidase SurE n=1 Tax=Haloarchaeobius amylolyticus TaxID=1198296 RepID=UPI00226F9C55|nr:5'/3'-nucleotidase SurE [Haloarchaeobius amylolyticus]